MNSPLYEVKRRMRNLMLSLATSTLILYSNALCVSTAEAQEEPIILAASGGAIVFSDQPDVVWIVGEIESGDYFHLRRILRRNEITTVALHSPGGSVSEALQMGAIIHDQQLTTYIPSDAVCASACSFIFFAGQERVSDGMLGVHQFYGPDEEARTDVIQFTVAEIVGFLNEFETPPFTFEYMFESRDMYFFNESEIERINREGDTLENDSDDTFLKINEKFSSYFFRDIEAETDRNVLETRPTTSTNVPAELPRETPPLSSEGIKRAVQYQLNRVGCTLGTVDGIIGVRSIAALEAFRVATNNPEPVSLDDFTDYEVVREIRSYRGEVCLSPPVLPTPNLSGSWAITLTCPSGPVQAVANVRKETENRYSVTYSNDRGGIGDGYLNQARFSGSGEIRWRNGGRTVFTATVSAAGTSISGSADDGCQISGRRR